MGDDYRTNGGRIIVQMGDRHEVAALVDGHSIIVQMGDRHEVAALVDGHSIIEVLSLHR